MFRTLRHARSTHHGTLRAPPARPGPPPWGACQFCVTSVALSATIDRSSARAARREAGRRGQRAAAACLRVGSVRCSALGCRRPAAPAISGRLCGWPSAVLTAEGPAASPPYSSAAPEPRSAIQTARPLVGAGRSGARTQSTSACRILPQVTVRRKSCAADRDGLDGESSMHRLPGRRRSHARSLDYRSRRTARTTCARALADSLLPATCFRLPGARRGDGARPTGQRHAPEGSGVTPSPARRDQRPTGGGVLVSLREGGHRDPPPKPLDRATPVDALWPAERVIVELDSKAGPLVRGPAPYRPSAAI